MNAAFAWPVLSPHVVGRDVDDDDIDGFGHVNNVRYIDWAMDAAWSHTNALGLSMNDYKRLGVGCVVWKHEFDYLAAAMPGDKVAIATWIAENDGRLRMTRGFEMRRQSDHCILFRGRTLFVSIDMASGKPARMPQSFIDAYRPAEKGS